MKPPDGVRIERDPDGDRPGSAAFKVSVAELEANRHRVAAAAAECSMLGAASVELGYARETPRWREAGWWFIANMDDGTEVAEGGHETPWDAAEAVVAELRRRRSGDARG